MKLNIHLKNQKFILVIFLLILTLILAVIHNLSNLFSDDTDGLKSSQEKKLQIPINNRLDTTYATDIYYYKNAINLYNLTQSEKKLTQLDEATNAFNLLINKFPNSNYISDVKLRLQELFTLRKRFAIRDSITNKISDYNKSRQFNKSLTLLSISKKFFDADEYRILNNNIVEERDKPIKLSITELLSQANEYDGKIVEVSELHPITNDIQHKYFTVYKSTGSGSLDFDTDLRLTIRYADAVNRDKLVYLTGNKSPDLTVIGKFVEISFFGSYIDAKEIIY